MASIIYHLGRKLLFPGFDINTRARAALCKFWETGERRVLDAGCGNGYFSYLAWKSGATVDAVSFESDSIAKANNFFTKQIATGKLRFIYQNLYELDYPEKTFDEIICYETIEHLMGDREMVARFSKWLKPGGYLHLCAPNKWHHYNANITPSPIEDGWHVRHGYDQKSYQELCQAANLEIVSFAGVSNQIVYSCDRFCRAIRIAWGDLIATPFFFLILPLWPWFCLTSPETGLSIYAKAKKPD